MNKNIIFDFDGTLVDSRNLIIEFYNEIAKRDNYKIIAKEDVDLLSTLPISDRCKKLGVPLLKIPSMLIEVRNKYKNNLWNIKVKNGIVEMLNYLKSKGHTLNIITSNDEGNVKEFLKFNNIDVFKNVYSSKDIFGKHHTINGFIKKYNIDRQNTFYVGDELRDIISCKKAKVKIIAVEWGYDSASLLSDGKPDYLVSSPEEIMEIVEAC